MISRSEAISLLDKWRVEETAVRVLLNARDAMATLDGRVSELDTGRGGWPILSRWESFRVAPPLSLPVFERQGGEVSWVAAQLARDAEPRDAAPQGRNFG